MARKALTRTVLAGLLLASPIAYTAASAPSAGATGASCYAWKETISQSGLDPNRAVAYCDWIASDTKVRTTLVRSWGPD